MADEATGRRKTLEVLVAAGSCALGAAMVGPSIVFVLAPAKAPVGDGKARWVKVAKVSQLKDDVPTKIAVVADARDAWSVEKNAELGAIWVRKKAGNIQVFSSVCPHLGCSVQADEQGYKCPCHDSRFDPNGKKESGPSPRDMDALDSKVEGEDLLVDFHRFKIGTSEREVIG
jgi:Rieske Fe-S protein